MEMDAPSYVVIVGNKPRFFGTLAAAEKWMDFACNPDADEAGSHESLILAEVKKALVPHRVAVVPSGKWRRADGSEVT